MDQAVKIIKEAGKMMLTDEGVPVFEKQGHANFVTQMDKDVQDFLIANLQKAYPKAKFFAEEKENQRMDEGAYFVIDPIDGTLNYIYKRSASAISVAFVQNRKPLWGIVYDPYQNKLYTAKKGEGAFENGKRMKVGQNPYEKALTAFGTSPYNANLAKESMLCAYRFLRETADLRRSGSAAIDLCDIAGGRSDIFFELTLSPWDFAAGALIVEEAGGIITQTSGSPLVYDQNCSLLAASAVCYHQAKAVFRQPNPCQ